MKSSRTKGPDRSFEELHYCFHSKQFVIICYACQKTLNDKPSSYLANKNHVAKVAFSVPETLFKSMKNSNTALFENQYLNIFCPQNAFKYDKYEGRSCVQSLV